MEFGFVIKKSITFFVEPFGMIITLFILGLYLLYRKKELFAKYSLSFSVALLFLYSYQPVSNFLVSKLENEYGKYTLTKQVSYIHVLGNGHNTDPSQPISSQISDAGIKRVIEGVTLHFQMPESKLIFTGYEGDTNTSNAEMNAVLARSLGVKKENMIINPLPKDTKEEALFAQTIVAKEEFILVTSATHMPRSMQLFISLGLNPLAAPTDFRKEQKSKFLSAPSSGNLDNSQRALHEYIGILWSKLRG